METGTPCAGLTSRVSCNSYTFPAFLRDVEWRTRGLSRTITDPDFVWPGLLILDLQDGLSAESFAIGGTALECERLVDELVETIKRTRARRFAWVMPCLREDKGVRIECLLLVVAERHRVEAVLADLLRRPGEAPRLGPFKHGPFGSGARRVSGLFVEPLLEALDL
jgi:hypothetical protein